MDALGGSWWSSHPFKHIQQRGIRRRKNHRNTNQNASSSSSSAQSNVGFRFPLKQAVTAGSLALTGDTIAQLRNRRTSLSLNPSDDADKDIIQDLLSSHDWIRALRMTSYGFLFYGPGSYVWYQTLDRYFPQPTVKNLLTKVLLNQIILGPAVIAVVFAWNNLWQGKVSELPKKYQRDALPTLLDSDSGFPIVY
ncbi:PXMP2/4 family protein 4 [Bienertia sinuspersici]